MATRPHILAPVALAVALLLPGCGGARDSAQVTLAIQSHLNGANHAPSTRGADTPVGEFYAAREHKPVWAFDGRSDRSSADGAPTAPASVALALLRRAAEHGLEPRDYGIEALERDVAAPDNADGQALAALDVRLTTALLTLGHDVAIGRSRPEAVDARWKRRRQAPDLARLLSEALAEQRVDSWLDRVRPTHPEYAALQARLAAGTVTDADVVRRIAINLERWRWMPDDLGARHVLVNIPAFHMAVREQGRPVLDMRVVVGTAARATPIFSGDMRTVVFSPYWNIPDSIAEGETTPAAARDPAYLARNNIEILRREGGRTTTVRPEDVQWDDPAALEHLAFRQKPGAGNALGHVKFLFPNAFDVYLHDTPADELFARPGRALSHGCVRLEAPERLAEYVMQGQSGWDAARIQRAMYSGKETPVTLNAPLPVHLVYFTVWPGEGDALDTWPDVYGYDARQQAAATRGRTTPDSARPK